MVTIQIDKKEMTHLKDESVYNRNIYTCGNMGVKLLEICHEDYDFYEYRVLSEGKETFLGCSEDGLTIELFQFFS